MVYDSNTQRHLLLLLSFLVSRNKSNIGYICPETKLNPACDESEQTHKCCFGVEVRPKMAQPKVLSGVKDPAASQDESGATPDSMTELITTISKKSEDMNKRLKDKHFRTKTSVSKACFRI